MSDILARLDAVIAARADADAETSHVARILSGGVPHAARKLGEEAVETVIAALDGDARELAGEAADLIFHLLILLRARGLSLADVEAELERREGVSGVVEKAERAG